MGKTKKSVSCQKNRKLDNADEISSQGGEKKVNVLKKVNLSAKVAFFTALVAGLFSQGMGMFNKFSWHDDVSAMFHVGATFKSGRWMLGLLSELESWLYGGTPVSLPAFNGFFSLLLIALSAALITSILKIHRPFFAGTIGALMVVFPVITGFFGYMFTAHYYCFSLFLTVAGVYLICGKRWWMWIAGALLIGNAIGIYQAFLPLGASLLLFRLILFATEEGNRPKELIKTAAITLLALVLAMGFYFGMNRLFLQLRHVKLSSYQGISDMANLTLSDILDRVSYAYTDFLMPDEYAKFSMYPLTIRNLYTFFLIAAVLLSLERVIRCFLRKRIFSGCCTAVLLFLIPAAVNLIFVMVDLNNIHSLMTYGQIGLFLWVTCLADRLEWKFGKIALVAREAVAIFLVLLCVMYGRYDNECYLRAALTQQEAISFYTTLITRIQSTEGYHESYPVVFVRNGWYSNNNLFLPEELEHITQIPYLDLNSYLNDYAFKSFIKYWCGYSPEYKSDKEYRNNPDILSMPFYPNEGSIRIIDECVIVHF